MDRDVININKELLKIIEKGELTANLQLPLIKFQGMTTKAAKNFFRIIIEAGIIDNEQLIDILYNNKTFPLLRATPENIKIYDYSKIDQYIKWGYFIYINDKQDIILVINDITYLRQLTKIHNTNIQLVRKKDFYQILEQNFSHLNIIRAKHFLEFATGNIVTRNINYTKEILIFLIIYFSIFINFQHLFHTINIFCYFSQNILKFILFKRVIIAQNIPLNYSNHWHQQQPKNAAIESNHAPCYPINPPKFCQLSSCIPKCYYKKVIWGKHHIVNYYCQHLPIYTILLPLYKESNKLKSIIHYILNLDYPKNKLDVKIIIEADDLSMEQESILSTLPSYMHLIKVPFSLPRTKPKALNYAMQYCKGQYVVIYDAEDRPAPDQLLKAVIEFKTLPNEYVCLQAKLSFYNENENLLTKLFSIEYCIWFEYLLTGLSLMSLPVLLGGTSNHFKLEILQRVGFWDAYNVTEDADLGLRLSSFNYKVSIIDSYTFEESPIDIISWIHQRSRWIKGFFQTFLVFLAQKDKCKKFKLTHIIVILIFVGFSSYSFCFLPFLIIIIKINNFSIIHYLWVINTFFAFSYLYGSALFILLIKKNKINNFKILDIIALLLWPCYFLLHTIAGYKAIWEIIFIPFKWNKTKHGVSKQQ